MTDRTLIVDIKRNALDDGPGIRTLIFFKGCPLSCVWCQNPEARSAKREISFDKNNCCKCETCIKICSKNAIKFTNEFRIDRSLCDFCGKCIPQCPNFALKYVGREYSIPELIEILLKDKIFYDNSGGGVTLSGGEPTYHMTYVNALLKELKKEQIHACIETSGFYDREKFNQLILPYIDLVYYDLKIFDATLHIKYCSVSNEKILSNFEDLIKTKKVKMLPRIPLIPRITTTDENLVNFSNYLKSLNVKELHLLAYNPLWLSKCEQIGVKIMYGYSDWLNSSEKEHIRSIFSDFNVNNF